MVKKKAKMKEEKMQKSLNEISRQSFVNKIKQKSINKINQKKSINKIKQQISINKIKHRTEVLVIGGGVAGVSAAVAAARCDRQVILVEKDTYLGGLATGGCVLYWQGFKSEGSETLSKGSEIWGGLGLEIIQNLQKLNGVRFTKPNFLSHAIVDPELLKYVCQDLVLKSGVRLIQNLMAIGVNKMAIGVNKIGDDAIKSVVFQTATNLESIEIEADIFIDATGDGNIVAWSGDSFNYSKLPISFSWNFGGIDIENLKIDFFAFQQKFQNFTSDLGKVDDLMFTSIKDTLWCNGTYFENFDPLNPDDLTFIECQGRERAIKLLQLLRKNIPECKNAFLFQTSTTIGVRTSRLLKGQHCLTFKEVENGICFGDSIGLAISVDSGNKPFIFEIPYRCLVSNYIRNLLVAGRCISVTPARGEFGGVLEGVRQIPSCIVTGQGAGCAAALAIKDNILPFAVSAVELKEKLIKQNVKVNK